MKHRVEPGEFDLVSYRSRRYLGTVILLLFVTGCIGLQVVIFLASTGAENRFWDVGILAKSSADYSLDEGMQIAPISPDILEDLALGEARPSETPIDEQTPPAIGQIVPSSTTTGSTPGGTGQPTLVPTGNGVTATPGTPTLEPTMDTTKVPTTTSSPTSGTSATPTPTFTVSPTVYTATTKVSQTSTPTPTPTSTSTIKPTTVPTSTTNPTAVPTATPTATKIPTLIPTPTPNPTAAPTPVPTSAPTPTPTGVSEIPTPYVPPTEPPPPTEEPFPSPGLDIASTPMPPLLLMSTRLDGCTLKIANVFRICQVFAIIK